MQNTEYEKNKDAVAVYLFDWGEAKIDATKDKALTVLKHFAIKILKPEGLQFKFHLDIKYITFLIQKKLTLNMEYLKINT